MADYHGQVVELRKNFRTGFSKDVEWRKNQLKSLSRMYEENEDLIVEALKKDLRKSKWETGKVIRKYAGRGRSHHSSFSVVCETDYLKNDLRAALSNIDEWVKDRPVRKQVSTLFDQTVVRPEPFGVVLVMGAWNYPFNLTMGPVHGALAAGNCVVVKPSELAENSASVMASLLPKYLDPRCSPYNQTK